MFRFLPAAQTGINKGGLKFDFGYFWRQILIAVFWEMRTFGRKVLDRGREIVYYIRSWVVFKCSKILRSDSLSLSLSLSLSFSRIVF